MTDLETTYIESDRPVELFNPPIPNRLDVEHISEVFGINALDLFALPEELTFDEFEAIGNWVQMTAAASPWWEGDWGNYGEIKFGDEYFSAISIEWSDSTEHARRRVTAGVFPHSERREELSFEHHQIVAQKIRKGVSLQSERHAWLDLAIRDGLTAPQLAKAIRDSQAIEANSTDDSFDGGDGPDVSGPEFSTFNLSFKVAASDGDAAWPLMERAETALRAELGRIGIAVEASSAKRR